MSGEKDALDSLMNARADQRITHELLVSALGNQFEGTPKDGLHSFIRNQLNRNSDFEDGYDGLIKGLIGNEDLFEIAEGKPITEEGKEDLKKFTKAKSLLNKVVQESYDCLLGR